MFHYLKSSSLDYCPKSTSCRSCDFHSPNLLPSIVAFVFKITILRNIIRSTISSTSSPKVSCLMSNHRVVSLSLSLLLIDSYHQWINEQDFLCLILLSTISFQSPHPLQGLVNCGLDLIVHQWFLGKSHWCLILTTSKWTQTFLATSRVWLSPQTLKCTPSMNNFKPPKFAHAQHSWF